MHSDIIRILFDPAITHQFATIHDYCAHHKMVIDAKDLTTLIRKIETHVYNQIHYYAHLMYHYMVISGDWGEVGEQQVKVSFCRNILKIHPNDTLEPHHIEAFNSSIIKTIQKYDIRKLSATDAQQALRSFTLLLLKKTIPLFDLNIVTIILRFLTSDTFLHVGQHGQQIEFIFGKGRVQHHHGHAITFIQKEYIRTPNNVVSVVAIMGHQTIYIRSESLSRLFAQKWVKIFDYNELELLDIFSNKMWNIMEGIKQVVLEKYGIDSKEALLARKDELIQDVSETIIHHEIGHGYTQRHIIPSELSAIAQASNVYGENIYTALIEFLSDFSVHPGQLKSPIQNIVSISDRDTNRATRMYLMYLSDCWFYNAGDTYMHTYSDVMVLILIRYIEKNHTVNFGKLKAEYGYGNHADLSRSYFNRILSLFTTDIIKLKALIETAQFSVSDTTIGFKAMATQLIQEFKKNDGVVHTDQYEFMAPFWSNIVSYVKSHSDRNDEVASFIKTNASVILKKIMILSCGKKMAVDYGYDHRRYIDDRMTELEFVAINPD